MPIPIAGVVPAVSAEAAIASCSHGTHAAPVTSSGVM